MLSVIIILVLCGVVVVLIFVIAYLQSEVEALRIQLSDKKVSGDIYRTSDYLRFRNQEE